MSFSIQNGPFNHALFLLIEVLIEYDTYYVPVFISIQFHFDIVVKSESDFKINFV